jgi:hypothetical protein
MALRHLRARLPSSAARLIDARAPAGAARRIEARLRTGGAAHLLGGTLDLVQALVRYRLARRGRKAP